jgi:hypothetical protein
MRDPHNPTDYELRAWAAEPGAVEPVQDWDVMIAGLPHPALYVEMAGDYGCPNRAYFLRVLYLLVGDAVRTEFRVRSRDEVLTLLERSRRVRHPAVQAWRHRARALLDDPSTFDYDAWCAGGLARGETPDD